MPLVRSLKASGPIGDHGEGFGEVRGDWQWNRCIDGATASVEIFETILGCDWYLIDTDICMIYIYICFIFEYTFLVGIPCTSAHRNVIWLQSCNLLFWVESLKARIWEWQEHYHLNLFYTMYNDSYKFQYEMKKARSSGGRRHGFERSEL